MAFLFKNEGIVSSVTSPIRSVVARVDSIVSAPIRALDSLNEDVHDLFDTYSENKKLKKKVAELENQSEVIDSLKFENDQLNSAIKISTASGDVFGILESYDSDKKCFVVSNLNSSIDIDENDSVVTSGLDGDTVANIAVGSVSSVKNSSDNLERVVYVTPAADFSDISYVTIIGD